ncbi:MULTISPECIES: VOC family protein [unclassified Cryobacterium]|uniref:VOC family protein n=1 Tax=unclassified Cryobacterium TaxID=2649013 RepID=UPI00106A6086|nr:MULTISPECIES: VOC family protein [unclassified Cryobacterium]MDY7528064.1 VOC family protein [Cryobacterium sp. 10C2]MDY7556182.1 VOC family protein [Cryobacterium sp. 10C3]MEB0002592.1 VOC family protein [Cryobacterium sp. RTC2.1]MEB0200447.1 VOC family protein [Cryobacterium sp. 5I3]MEB0285555.1 VOC family protein [Cryobacterium sp. 10S3]
MQITKVSARIRDTSEAAEFFENVLLLTVDRTVAREPTTIEVRIGTTLLELSEDQDAVGRHHLAVTIPSNTFAAARQWLEPRSALIGTPDADEFEFAAWNARSLYFTGPDRSVLEFIVRRDLDNNTRGAFTSADLLCISEVGVATDDVLATAEFLKTEADVRPYAGEPGRSFAPVGDTDGLLILVSPGRPWFPTTDRGASSGPILVEATGPRPGEYPLGAGSLLRIR